MRSYNGGPPGERKSKETIRPWHDYDNDSVGTALRDTTSSPGVSDFDFEGLAIGGLSPRPRSKSQPRQLDNDHNIGRAIA